MSQSPEYTPSLPTPPLLAAPAVAIPTLAASTVGLLVFAALATAPGTLRAQTASPASCAAPEARAFDFWIGDWDVVNRNRPAESPEWREMGTATDRVFPVVGGCALVEHWRGEAYGMPIVGWSVRAWDPESGSWLLALRWPIQGPTSFTELRGGFRHGRGEFFRDVVTPAGDSLLSRFTFSDVGPDAFRWEAQMSPDRGITWSGTWIMEFSRRTGSPVEPGPDSGRCESTPHRALDARVGEWRGTRTDASGATAPVTGRVTPILEGCALEERVTSDDGSWNWYAVRGFDEARGAWSAYRLSTDGTRLLREDAEEGATDVYVTADGLRRTRLESGMDGGIVLVDERRPTRDAGWRTVARVELGSR